MAWPYKTIYWSKNLPPAVGLSSGTCSQYILEPLYNFSSFGQQFISDSQPCNLEFIGEIILNYFCERSS